MGLFDFQDRSGPRRDVVRQIGIFTYVRYLVRQDVPGLGPCCAYCGAVLTKDGRTLDHVNNVARDNRPDNLVAACSDCNAAAGAHDERGWERLAERVADLGAYPESLATRVRAILDTPLPERADERVQALAWEWFGDRIQLQRDLARARRAKASGRDDGENIDDGEEVPF